MRRRLLRLLAVGTLGVMVVTAALLVFVVTSSSALRWALDLSRDRIPLSINGVHGSLLKGVHVDKLQGQAPGVRYAVEDLEIRMIWSCLLHSEICLEKVAAQAVRIELIEEGGQEANDDENDGALVIPRVALSEGSIETLVVVRGGERDVIEQLRIAGRYGDGALQVAKISGRHEWISWVARGDLALPDTWNIAAQLQTSEALSSVVGEDLAGSYTLEARGRGQSGEGQLRADHDASLALDGSYRIDQGSVQGDAVLAHGALLARRLPDGVGAWLKTDGPLRLSIQHEAASTRLDLAQNLLGFAPEPRALAIQLTRTGSLLELTDARLGAGERPPLRAEGSLGAIDALLPDLSVQLHRLQLPEALSLMVQDLSGRMDLRGDLAARHWSARDVSLTMTAGERSVAVDGSLTAADDPLLPLGALHVQLSGIDSAPPTRVSYARPDDRADAELIAGGELRAGELAWESMRASISAGPQRQLRGSLIGDLSTEFSLALESGETGVEFLLQPLDMVYQGQQFSIVEPMAGHWDPAVAALYVDATCVLWRRSSLCTEAASLGSSGSLAARLQLEDRYEGPWGDKSFSVSGAGSGTIGITWTAEEITSADLEVQMSSLVVDPLTDEDTRAPLRWEQVRVQGSLARDRQARVLLESDALGDLDLRLDERDGTWQGSLVARGLPLAPWNDLLPELLIEDGAFSADLSLGGSLDAPEVHGVAKIQGLSARGLSTEAQLEDLELELAAMGKHFTLAGAGLLGGGEFALAGQCCDGGVLTGTLEGRQNRLATSDGLTAQLSPQLSVELDRESATVAGTITVHGGVYEHNSPRDAGVRLSSDVRRIDLPDKGPRRFDLRADLRTIIEPGFSLRSSELESTLAGDLRLRFDADQPLQLYGDLRVLGGELRAYGQVLRLAEGSIGFVGDARNPELDLSAEREIRAENLRVGFKVQGSLEEPALALFSDPPRSERDTLSYLVRGRGPDAGATIDSSAMALSLGASAINRSGVLSGLETIPGLSDVSIGAEGSDDDVAATISAYVGRRLFLSYGVGIYEPVNALTARLYLRSRLWLEVVSRLESSFDLYYRFDRN